MPAVWEAAAFHHTALMTTLPRLRGVSATSAVRGSRSLEASASTAALRATHAACISSYVPVVLVTHRLRPGGKDGGEGGLGGERGGDGSDGGGGAIPSHRPPNRAVAQVQLQAIHVSEVEKTRHP